MPFSMRQQKFDRLCRGYKTLHPRLTEYCRGRVPCVSGGVDAYDHHHHRLTAIIQVNLHLPACTCSQELEDFVGAKFYCPHNLRIREKTLEFSPTVLSTLSSYPSIRK